MVTISAKIVDRTSSHAAMVPVQTSILKFRLQVQLPFLPTLSSRKQLRMLGIQFSMLCSKGFNALKQDRFFSLMEETIFTLAQDEALRF
jgi:hypothetical protein